jgi:hypothetical protein
MSDVPALLQPMKDRLEPALLHQTLEPADYADMAWATVADQAKLIAAIEAVVGLHRQDPYAEAYCTCDDRCRPHPGVG